MQFLSEPTPHAEAAKSIRGLPTVDRDTFNRLPDELRASAFLITGIAAHDILQDVRDMLATIPEGTDFEMVREAIAKRIQPAMGGNEKAAQARSLLIARAWTGRAYNQGIAAQLDNHTGAFPFRKRLSMGDERVRESHRALSGLILPANSPFWEKHTPPDAHNCRCYVVGVTRRAMERAKAADDAAIAAGTLDPAKRTVLEGPQLAKLDNEGILSRGPNEIFALDKEPGRVAWNPRTLLMPMEEIAKRYDAQTWADFEKWSRGMQIQPKKSLWDMLEANRPKGQQGTPVPPGTPAPAPAPAPAPKPAPKPKPTPKPKPAPAPAPAPAKSGIKPASAAPKDQVAASLAVKPSKGKVKAAAEEALAAISQVHSDGGLLASDLESKAMSNAWGAYAWRTKGLRVGSSTVRINPSGPHPVMTTLHEIGHKIDFEMVEVHLSGVSIATVNPAAAAIRKKIVAQLMSTAECKAIPTAGYSQRSQDYLLSSEELIARAYAQYITQRTGHPAATAELAATLAKPGMSLTQWQEASFAGVPELFDEMFVALGWAV